MSGNAEVIKMFRNPGGNNPLYLAIPLALLTLNLVPSESEVPTLLILPQTREKNLQKIWGYLA